MFRERFAGDLPAGASELADRVGTTWEAMAERTYENDPITIAHGDFRADNLMFDDATDGPDHVGVLDWQIAMRGVGVGDVGYLLIQSMTADDRRAHERDLVEQWYDALCASLGRAPEDFTLADAWDGYRMSAATMTALPIIGGAQADLANERGVALVREMATRAFSAAVELDAASLLPPA